MKNLELKGIIPPIITPMYEDETINTEELRRQVDRMIEGGVHALFPFGTNGEGYILNAKEKQLVLETVIDQCNGRVQAPAAFPQRRPLSRAAWLRPQVQMCSPSSLQALQQPARRSCMCTTRPSQRR